MRPRFSIRAILILRWIFLASGSRGRGLGSHACLGDCLARISQTGSDGCRAIARFFCTQITGRAGRVTDLVGITKMDRRPRADSAVFRLTCPVDFYLACRIQAIPLAGLRCRHQRVLRLGQRYSSDKHSPRRTARDVGTFVWFTLQRPNYLSVDQSAGVVFSRATALEVQRRSEVLLPIMDPNWQIRSELRAAAASGKHQIDSPDRPLTAANLSQICADTLLGFVISSQHIGFDALTHNRPRIMDGLGSLRLPQGANIGDSQVKILIREALLTRHVRFFAVRRHRAFVDPGAILFLALSSCGNRIFLSGHPRWLHCVRSSGVQVSKI